MRRLQDNENQRGQSHPLRQGESKNSSHPCGSDAWDCLREGVANVLTLLRRQAPRYPHGGQQNVFQFQDFQLILPYRVPVAVQVM